MCETHVKKEGCAPKTRAASSRCDVRDPQKLSRAALFANRKGTKKKPEPKFRGCTARLLLPATGQRRNTPRASCLYHSAHERIITRALISPLVTTLLAPALCSISYIVYPVRKRRNHEKTAPSEHLGGATASATHRGCLGKD